MSQGSQAGERIPSGNGNSEPTPDWGSVPESIRAKVEARLAEFSPLPESAGPSRPSENYDARPRGWLNLSYCNLDAPALRVLLRSMLANLPGLTSITLDSNQIGDDGIRALAEHAKGLPALAMLSLPDNEIGDAGIRALAEHAKDLPALERLDVRRNQIGDAGVRALAEHANDLPALAHLNLSDNQIGDAGVRAMAEHAANLPALAQLDLSGNQIGDAGIRALAEHAANLPVLAILDLSGNRMGDAGVRALAERARGFRALDTLGLDSNQIGDSGVRLLAKHAKEFSGLATLSLNHNKLGDEGVRVLAEHAKDFAALAKLELAGNQIGDNGARALAEHAKDLAELTELQLSQNNISDASAIVRIIEPLVPGKGSAGKLMRIFVGANPLRTPDGREIARRGFIDLTDPQSLLAYLKAEINAGAEGMLVTAAGLWDEPAYFGIRAEAGGRDIVAVCMRETRDQSVVYSRADPYSMNWVVDSSLRGFVIGSSPRVLVVPLTSEQAEAEIDRLYGPIITEYRGVRGGPDNQIVQLVRRVAAKHYLKYEVTTPFARGWREESGLAKCFDPDNHDEAVEVLGEAEAMDWYNARNRKLLRDG